MLQNFRSFLLLALKGDVLLKYFDQVGKLPKKIVFVDNKRKHVEAVEQAIAHLKIDYVGCRHGASDEKIRRFDKDVATIQHRYFGRILNDQAAMRLLND